MENAAPLRWCRIDCVTEEISLISSVFMPLGDTLATIAAQRALCQAAGSD